jgi:SAM-dependent methyltransferase
MTPNKKTNPSSGGRVRLFCKKLGYRLARIKEAYYEARLGIDTGPAVISISWQPTFYGTLEKIIRSLKLTPDDVFVDVGCGKGRVVFFVARQRLKKVIGIDVDPAMIGGAMKNLRRYRGGRTPVEFVRADVLQYDLSEGTIFYFFNPFKMEIFVQVIKNIKDSLATHPRAVRIVYYGAPLFHDVLNAQDWLVLDKVVEKRKTMIWRYEMRRV